MSKKGGGAGIIGLLILGGIIYGFVKYPVLGIIGVVVLVGLFILHALTSGPVDCEICGVELKKKSYEWNIDGKKKTVCPNCNRKMEKKASDDAFRDME